MPDAKRSLGTALKFMAWMPLWMLLPGPDTTRPLRRGDFSQKEHISLSANSSEWLQSHDGGMQPVHNDPRLGNSAANSEKDYSYGVS